jgi:hypothetical protein
MDCGAVPNQTSALVVGAGAFRRDYPWRETTGHCTAQPSHCSFSRAYRLALNSHIALITADNMTQEPGTPTTKSSLYYLARSKTCIGDGIFAADDLQAGQPLAVLERPLLASLESERLKDTCANCFVWTEGSAIGSRLYVKEGTSVQACAGCRRFRYCSKVSMPYKTPIGSTHIF